MSQYQKGKTNQDFTEARDSEWQWNPLGHMQVCTSLQTDNHASTLSLSFLQPDTLPATPNQQCQSTEGNSSSCNIKQTIKVAYTEGHGVYYLQRSTHCCRLPFQHPAPTDRLLQSASNPHNITTTFIHSQKYSCYDHLYNLAM